MGFGNALNKKMKRKAKKKKLGSSVKKVYKAKKIVKGIL